VPITISMKSTWMMMRGLIRNLAEQAKRNILRCLSENMLMITPEAALIRRSAFDVRRRIRYQVVRVRG
jgi:hypothetical protein